MPFNRPTLQSLINRSQADIEAELPGANARLRRTNLNILAKILSGLAHGLYGYLQWIADQVIYDKAEGSILRRWASIWLEQPVKPATFAVGPVTLTGINGVIIEAGTVLIRGDGIEYETDEEATIAAGSATVQVTALTAGQTGNAVAGVALTMTSPIAGVNGNAIVAAGGLTSGADEEEDDSIRARLISRIQQPPHGGAQHDYVTWALEVPGVTRAWCYPGELGVGTVVVRFVRDDDADVIPDAAEVEAVQDYIDERRPVTADVSVVAPIPDPIDFVFSDLTPNDAATRAAIEAELRDLLSREAEPNGTGVEGKILISHIREAISVAAGERNYVLDSPNADITHTTGQMATLGNITWP